MGDTEYKNRLFSMTDMIGPTDKEAAALARARWDSLGKPLRSFGKLEDAVIQMAAITGDPQFSLDRRAIVVMCGAHGVTAEGVTQTGSDVTRTVAENMTRGRASINIMAKEAGADVFVVDIGMDCPTYENTDIVTGKIISRKVARGTGDIAKEPAMTQEQCAQAMLAGIEIATKLAAADYNVIGLGEMGIGNTTPSSALVSTVLDLPPIECTGRGAGLSDEDYKRKVMTVSKAIARYWKATEGSEIRKDRHYSAQLGLEVMAQLGGYELAGMAGLCFGAALNRVPVIVDGFISQAAVLIARLMVQVMPEYLLASHNSAEPAGRKVLSALGLHPVIDAGMFCGEGTGAAAAMQLYAMGLAEYIHMGTFHDIQVEQYKLYDHNQ